MEDIKQLKRIRDTAGKMQQYSQYDKIYLYLNHPQDKLFGSCFGI